MRTIYDGGKVFTIPGPVLNNGGQDIGGAQLLPVPPPKNPRCPNFGVGMPHARFGGDALSSSVIVEDRVFFTEKKYGWGLVALMYSH